MTRPKKNHSYRIVLTGGPGGGKTTAADLFRREMGDSVAIVPEAATLLFSGGFPRSREVFARQAAQRAIYHVQRNLEDAEAALYPERILLCDRGTIDGVVYWPDGEDEYYRAVGSTEEAELARYDTVIFFETAAAGDLFVEGPNKVRIEDRAEAMELDRRLQAVWSRHPRYFLIRHEASFMKKLGGAMELLGKVLTELGARVPPSR